MAKEKVIYTSSILILIPQAAWAQDVLGVVIIFALVPLANIIFVILFSIIGRSLKEFLLHIGLVSLWIVLFWLFSSFTDSDFLAWLPVGLSIAHSVFLLFSAVHRLFREKAGRRDRASEI